MDAPDDALLTDTERAEREAAHLFGAPLPTQEQRTKATQKAFLDLLAEGCNFTEANAALGINRATSFRWRQTDPEFAQACRVAFKVSLDKLKAEAERRAVNGSDKLLMFLLERYDPAQFHIAQKLEHSGAVDLANTIIAARSRVKPEPGCDLC
jgi:hypothetical protein